MARRAPPSRPNAKAIGSLIGGTLDPVLKKRGLLKVELLNWWPDIVGEELAELLQVGTVLLVARSELLRAEMSRQLRVDAPLFEPGDHVIHAVQAFRGLAVC